jgi:hypothetical protein
MSIISTSHCHMRNGFCTTPHYRQISNNKLNLADSEGCEMVDRKKLFCRRQRGLDVLHFVLNERTVDVAVLMDRRRNERTFF